MVYKPKGDGSRVVRDGGEGHLDLILFLLAAGVAALYVFF